MDKRRPRKSYDHDFKRRVVSEALKPGVSVSKVARLHDINANLLFGWSKDPRFIPAVQDEAFLPVTIEAQPPGFTAGSPDVRSDTPPPELGIWIEGDVRLVAKGRFDPAALGTLIRTIRTSR